MRIGLERRDYERSGNIWAALYELEASVLLRAAARQLVLYWWIVPRRTIRVDNSATRERFAD